MPNDNPTYLTVYNSTDNASRATLYHGLSDGGATGSFPVVSVTSIYVFCLELTVNSGRRALEKTIEG